MSNNVTNIVVAGLGGQGVLKASDILADAAFRAGFDVKKSELHGMSQRGGSVWSDVRYGPEVFSPMIPAGEAEFLLALAADQVEPHLDQLRPGGVLLRPDAVNTEQLANRKSLNVALLGVLSTHLSLSEDCWMGALRANLPEALFDVNRQAFLFGREQARSAIKPGNA